MTICWALEAATVLVRGMRHNGRPLAQEDAEREIARLRIPHPLFMRYAP